MLCSIPGAPFRHLDDGHWVIRADVVKGYVKAGYGNFDIIFDPHHFARFHGHRCHSVA